MTPEEAEYYEEALSRILEAEKTGAVKLNPSGLHEFTRFPPELERLTSLVITLLSRVIDFFRECGVAVGTMSGRSQQPRPDRFQDLLQRQTRSFFLPQGRWSG